ncbi:hypothetical protein ACI8AG_17830 [Blastococcus sp. SYSU DS0552]
MSAAPLVGVPDEAGAAAGFPTRTREGDPDLRQLWNAVGVSGVDLTEWSA